MRKDLPVTGLVLVHTNFFSSLHIIQDLALSTSFRFRIRNSGCPMHNFGCPKVLQNYCKNHTCLLSGKNYHRLFCVNIYLYFPFSTLLDSLIIWLSPTTKFISSRIGPQMSFLLVPLVSWSRVKLKGLVRPAVESTAMETRNVNRISIAGALLQSQCSIVNYDTRSTQLCRRQLYNPTI